MLPVSGFHRPFRTGWGGTTSSRAFLQHESKKRTSKVPSTWHRIASSQNAAGVEQDQQQLPQELHPLEDSAGCPFLNAKAAPMINIPFLTRVHLQVFHPARFQELFLQQRGEHGVLQGAEAPGGFSAFHMPATAELTKDVFAAEAAGAITQGLAELGGFRAFALLLGEDSLLVMKDGERHIKLRALMQPAFSPQAIAALLPDMQVLVQRYLSQWLSASDAGRVKAHEEMKKLTFEFIMQAVIGGPIPEQDLARMRVLFQHLSSGLIAWPYIDLPFTPWRRALRARQELLDYFQAGVAAARQQLACEQPVSGLLGMLVTAEDELGHRLTDSEITANLLLLLLAGHDTSSTALTRCISNLQDNPWVVEKLRQEQRTVVETHGPTITAAALKDMTYADAVIRETLRLYPVVAALLRVSTRDLKLGEYFVPKGMTVVLPLGYLARHEPRWADRTGDLDPATFNPDRMLTAEGAKPGQLMPFGGGVRRGSAAGHLSVLADLQTSGQLFQSEMGLCYVAHVEGLNVASWFQYCLGAGLAVAEMKVVLALLARQCTFTADNDTEWKPGALGYYPANGLPLVLRSMMAAPAADGCASPVVVASASAVQAGHTSVTLEVPPTERLTVQVRYTASK